MPQPSDVHICFVYVILNNDLGNADWGYFSMRELEEINLGGIEVDRDLYWRPRKASDVEKIMQSCRQ